MKKLAMLLLVVILCITAAAGCSSGSGFDQSTSEVDTAESQEDTVSGNGVVAQTQDDSEADDSTEQTKTQTTDSRKVIKQAHLMIRTTQYDESIKKFELMVASFDAYIESSSVDGDMSGNDSPRNARYTVRVPSDRLEEFLNSVGDIGSVTNKSISGEDITQNYFDAEARLKTLRAEHDRILGLMEKAQRIDDIMSIEQRLTEVENKIEQLTGELKKWDSLVSLSTVTVRIDEVRDIIPTNSYGLGGQMASIFRVSLNVLLSICRFLVLAVTAISPFVAGAAVIAAIYLRLRKRIRKRKEKKAKISADHEDDFTPNTK